MLEKIISGGQTGVDRAALDVSIKMGIVHGGWCPRGRAAEDGIIAEHYNLIETNSGDPSERTKLNIQDSDGTLILVTSIPVKVNDGTILTIHEVKEKRKLHLIIDLSKNENVDEKIANWIKENNIQILNIAGPRESQCPGIYGATSKTLISTLSLIKAKINVTSKKFL